jgi:hypothetical protein
LWFGLVFVGFVIFSPSGLVGVWEQLRRRWKPAPDTDAAMSGRKIYTGLPLPAYLCPPALSGKVLQVEGVSKHFGGIRATRGARSAGSSRERWASCWRWPWPGSCASRRTLRFPSRSSWGCSPDSPRFLPRSRPASSAPSAG